MPRFRGGSLKGVPVSVQGPFKAMLTEISVTRNLGTGRRDAKVGLALLAEPRLTRFRYGMPELAKAVDDQGREWHGRSDRLDHFRQADSNLILFDDDWAKIKLEGIDERLRRLAVFSVELPLQMILSKREVRAAHVLNLKPGTRLSAGPQTFEIESANVFDGNVTVNIVIHNPASHEWGYYKFRIERAPKDVIPMFPRQAGGNGRRLTFELHALGGNLKAEDELDLVISFPDKMRRVRLRFDFEDVELP